MYRWRWQGGAGLLAWGDALKELGRDDEARSAWTQVHFAKTRSRSPPEPRATGSASQSAARRRVRRSAFHDVQQLDLEQQRGVGRHLLPRSPLAVRRLRRAHEPRLAAAETDSPFGKLKIVSSRNGLHQLLTKLSIVQYQDGKKVVVYPADLAGSNKVLYPVPAWKDR